MWPSPEQNIAITNQIIIRHFYLPGYEEEKEKDTGWRAGIISNAKTIPSSNRCRESLDISAMVFVVHVVFVRCAISNYLPVYNDGMHEQFLFQPTRNAAGDTFVAVNNNDTSLVSTLRGKINVLFLVYRFRTEIQSAGRIKMGRQYVCDQSWVKLFIYLV